MEKQFRPYNILHGTAFDLISGDTEVKQTTGLAYLLSRDEKALMDIVNEGIPDDLGIIKASKFDSAIVHSEMISENGNRAGIVVKLYKDGEPFIALLVEAKNVGAYVSGESVKEQLKSYMDSDEFPELKGFRIYGCALTKNSLFMGDEDGIKGITWERVVELLKNSGSELSEDYINFLTNIKGSMKFYEEEVFSIPAGESYDLVVDHPHVYECPNEGKVYTSMRKPLFMTFRQRGGGEMEKVFKIKDIIIMNPWKDMESFWKSEEYSDDVRNRVYEYAKKRWGSEENFDNEEKLVYVMDPDEVIELDHKPKPPRNNPFRGYYKLTTLLDPSKTEVKTEFAED